MAVEGGRIHGRDSGRRLLSLMMRYRRDLTGSSTYTISSSSGTISTTYTSSLSRSRLSTISTEAAMLLDNLEETVEQQMKDVSLEETVEQQQMKRIKSLVQEFFSNGGGDGDMTVLERWFTELGVGWVLGLADGVSAGELKNSNTFDTWHWIQALTGIIETIRLTMSLFSDPGSVDMPSICEEEPDTDQGLFGSLLGKFAWARHARQQATIQTGPQCGKQDSGPDQLQLAQFFQETMLKMLTFVDLIADLDPNITSKKCANIAHLKIRLLLHVRDALSEALSRIPLSSHSMPSEVGRIQGEIVSLLSAKEGKAGEAIWSTIKDYSTRILVLPEDHGDDSSDIHNVASSIKDHITFLLDNYSALHPIVSEAASLGKYVPPIQDLPPLDSMIMEMTSSLEEKLVNMSKSFPDQGLRFIFLLNNAHFMQEQFRNYHFPVRRVTTALTCKVQGYMDSYLQVSWAPVLSCLLNPTPLCLLGKNLSPLPKFESEFQKTYTTQKLWRVPDPELRGTLREAVTRKIMSVYTKYIEDNNISTPRIASQELQEMLQELFEG